MTAVLEAVEVAPTVRPSAETRAPAPRRFPRWPAALLPWLLPFAALVWALLDTGVSGRDIALYSFYFAVDVVLPGTLVHRALRGSRGNLPEDLGLGAATGLLLMLGGWALAAATDKHALLPWWPALFVVPFLAVPRLHRHWRVSNPRPLPLRWSWIVAGGLVLLVGSQWPGWTTTPLPPAGGVLYQDYFYHLALVHEMMRAMPFQVPQMAGEALHYHYLSDADIATASLITKIDPAVVLLRLWTVPIAAAAVLVLASLTREISGRWWAGALGGVTAVVGLPLVLGGAAPVAGGSPVNASSPSQTYGVTLLALLVVLGVDAVRGQRLRWSWLLVFPLALACAGAKSSALPPFVAGLLAATVIVAFRHRRRLLPTLAMSALTVVAIALGLRLFAGGGAGTLGLQPFALFFWFEPYRATLGQQDTVDGNRFLPYGVEHAGTAGWLFLAWLVVWWLLMQAPRMAGLVGVAVGPTRREPAVWLLSGMAAAGAGAAYLMWHPSASQVYFFTGALPFGTVAVACVMAAVARSWRPVLAGALAGGAWVLLAPQMPQPVTDRMSEWALTLAEPLVRAAVVAAGVAAIGLILWRVRTGRTPWRALLPALLAAALVGGLTTGAQQYIEDFDAAVSRPTLPGDRPDKAVLTEELVAAQWLAKNTGRDDIVATNVHCTPLGWVSGCDSRAFWVAGVGGRRTVIESWAYTDEVVAQNGVNGQGYVLQPAPDIVRFVLNQRVFADGKADDLAQLRSLYGVKWLFADDRAAGGVSPHLSDLATMRFSSGPVTIYELP